MSNNNLLGSGPVDRSDWNSAWEIVSRLAAVREAALSELEKDVRQSSTVEPAPEQQSAMRPAAGTPSTAAAIDPEQLARAVAEIEQAAAALRRSDPTLEAWTPDASACHPAPAHRSVWMLVGGLWLSASLVVAAGAGAIVFLLG
jgi:hypothetical protein